MSTLPFCFCLSCLSLLSACLSLSLSVCLSISLPFCLPVYFSTCLSACLSFCQSTCRVCLPVYVSACLPVYLFCLSRLSYLPACLPVSQSVCLFICLSLRSSLSLCYSLSHTLSVVPICECPPHCFNSSPYTLLQHTATHCNTP